MPLPAVEPMILKGTYASAVGALKQAGDDQALRERDRLDDQQERGVDRHAPHRAAAEFVA